MSEFLEIDGAVGNDRLCGEMTSGHWSERAWLFMEVVIHWIYDRQTLCAGYPRVTLPYLT